MITQQLPADITHSANALFTMNWTERFSLSFKTEEILHPFRLVTWQLFIYDGISGHRRLEIINGSLVVFSLPCAGWAYLPPVWLPPHNGRLA